MRCLVMLVMIGVLAGRAQADGGTVRVHAPAGPFVVTVFTTPTPFRAGPIDVSVMVQDRGGEPVLDADVTVRLADATGEFEVVATRTSNDNRLLYEALTTLPRAGSWELSVEVRRAGVGGEVAARVEAAGELPDLVRYWPQLLFPPLAVVVFILHQRRRRAMGLLVGAESA